LYGDIKVSTTGTAIAKTTVIMQYNTLAVSAIWYCECCVDFDIILVTSQSSESRDVINAP